MNLCVQRQPGEGGCGAVRRLWVGGGAWEGECVRRQVCVGVRRQERACVRGGKIGW
jgi:hypothetical protein